ncbi:hypothetical protein [Pararhizobium mangrovi]|uniref:Apyrase n=1 Tax=Pararhizobium mangrovi TaxID=2590452 RepID=A0A506U7R3_9HYPH|nr:hypothetical protein [Pararhizobium mangrovi]TPW29910.1 hypothetical protein FJU11_06475 [Pararhizobium mangrovi]
MQAYDRQRLERYDTSTTSYTFAQITDEDHDTQVRLDDGETFFQARLRFDRAHRHVDEEGRARYTFEMIANDEGGERRVYSKFGEVDEETFRGGEFSELVRWGRHLLAFDDRTGIVGEIRGEDYRIIPRQILMTGPGDAWQKGFKCEWATLYGNELIVGSHGKNDHQAWVKRIDPDGYKVVSEDWGQHYRRLREACGVGSDGYVTHEAVDWDPYGERWYFFPRKVSFEPFDEPVDEREKGNNRLIVADANFEDIEVRTVGEPTPERGPSSLKLVPGRPNEFLYVKSVEIGDRTESWIGAADVEGNLLAEETKLGDFKCEGIEFM